MPQKNLFSIPPTSLPVIKVSTPQRRVTQEQERMKTTTTTLVITEVMITTTTAEVMMREATETFAPALLHAKIEKMVTTR